MNILVIGGTGAIGSALCAELTRRAHNLVVVGRETSDPAAPSPATFVTCDRSAPGFARLVTEAAPRGGFDAVIDIACYSAADADGVLALDCCVQARVLMVSTGYVYDETGPMPHDEHAPIAAPPYLGGYCAQKREAELAYLHSSRSDVCVVRLPHVIARSRPLGIIPLHTRDPATLSWIAQGLPLLLVSGGRQAVQTIWQDDVAGCVAGMVETDHWKERVYNLANPEVISGRGYYAEIADALGCACPAIVEVPATAVLASRWGWRRSLHSRILDCDRYIAEFGPVSWTSFAESIGVCVKSLVDRGAMHTPTNAGLKALAGMLGSTEREIVSVLDNAASARPPSAIGDRMNQPPLSEVRW